MSKKNIIALLVLVIAVGAYLIISMNEPNEKVFNYFGKSEEAFHTIVIADSSSTITLVRNNDTWEMTDPVESPIKQTKVDDLMKRLVDSKTSTMPISILDTAQETYNVTNLLGTHIKISDAKGNVLRETIVGKADNYNFSYARHPQSTEIYQLSENLTWTIKPDVKSWRENAILNLNSDNIIDFQAITPERDYKFTYADSLWIFTENDIIHQVTDDNEVMKKLLKHFQSLRATDFLDKEFENYEALLQKPHLSLRINSSDEESKVITVIPYDATSDLMQVGSQASPLYLIQKTFMSDFNFELSELIE